MKKILMATTAVLALTATSALAIDINDRWSWNTDVEATHNFSTGVSTGNVLTGLEYSVVTDWTVNVKADANPITKAYNGTRFGVEYSPSSNVMVEGYALRTGGSFQYIVGTKFSF